MEWIYQYQLFLFDFDGILVNTEELHFKAYQKLCKYRGFSLSWDMPTYVRHAMYSAVGLKNALYKEFPKLETDWEILYEEKKKIYAELIKKEGVSLMPAVSQLLIALEKAAIKRCVVTHSSMEQIKIIREQIPLLNSIPTWITREDYKLPKPSSECYEKAISQIAKEEDKIIGFEDSPRGLKALLETRAKGCFISPYFNQKEITAFSQEMGKSFSSFDSFTSLCKEFG